MGRLFGTDGVRGVANTELTCELAMEIGRAAAEVLTLNSRTRSRVVVGMDTRMSSRMLCGAVCAGLCSVGADVMILGEVPTPAVAFLVGKYKADAGVMISASHNSAEFNGIKIFGGDGYKLPDVLEEKIEEIVLDRDKDSHEAQPVIGGDVGRVTLCDSAVKDYVDHLKSTVMYSLEGIKVAVDCANGSASVSARQLFEQLGAECSIINATPDGVNINRDCGSTHMEALRDYVLEGGYDLGVAFDGDADRCLCVDDKGEFVDGDQIMAICALDMKERGRLPKKAVVGTVMTNLGFIKFCEANGLRFSATKVGDRFVLEEMLQEGYVFGGEQSGHLIFSDFATTGDGQLSAIQLISLMRRKGQKLSQLASVMKRFPQKTVNVRVTADGKVSFYTMSDIKKAINDAKNELGDNGRIVVRPSGTEPLIRVMVEGENEEEISRIVDRVADVIRNRIGVKA